MDMKPYTKPAFEKWMERVSYERDKYYKSIKGVDLNEKSLRFMFDSGFTPTQALNALIEAT